MTMAALSSRYVAPEKSKMTTSWSLMSAPIISMSAPITSTGLWEDATVKLPLSATRPTRAACGSTSSIQTMKRRRTRATAT